MVPKFIRPPWLGYIWVIACKRSSLLLYSLSFRRDIIKKTIFRKFKKYYRDHFKTFYDYNRCRRQTVEKQSERIFNNAKEFLISIFGPTYPVGLELYLVAMIDVKKKYMHENDDYYAIRLKTSDLINSFNVDRAEEILNHHQVAFLFIHCLKDTNFRSTIMDQKSDYSLQTKYMEELEEIQFRWVGAMAARKSPPFLNI